MQHMGSECVPQARQLTSMHNMGITICFIPILTPLTTNATLFVSAKERLGRGLFPRVDEHGAGLETLANALRTLDVLAPDAGTKTGIRVVRSLDDFLLIRPWLGRDDGAEGLLGDDQGVVWRVIDNSGLD